MLSEVEACAREVQSVPHHPSTSLRMSLVLAEDADG